MPTQSLDFKKEFLRRNRFRLVMPPLGGSEGTWFETNLLECRLPSINLEPAEYWDGIEYNRFMKSAVFQNVFISCYVDTNADPLYKWIQQHLKHVSQGTGLLRSADKYKRNIDIVLLDGYELPVDTWQLKNCQISNVGWGDLSYTSQGDILTVSLELIPDRVILPGGQDSPTSENTEGREVNNSTEGMPASVIKYEITFVNFDSSQPGGGSFEWKRTLSDGSSTTGTVNRAPTTADYQEQFG